MQENLSFSALLWLPMSYTWKERKDKVNTMISDLKLRKVADSLVKVLLCMYILLYTCHVLLLC